MRLTVLDGRPSNTVTCRGLGGTGLCRNGQRAAQQDQQQHRRPQIHHRLPPHAGPDDSRAAGVGMVNRKSHRSRPAPARSRSRLSLRTRLGDGRHQQVAGHRRKAIEASRQHLGFGIGIGTGCHRHRAGHSPSCAAGGRWPYHPARADRDRAGPASKPSVAISDNAPRPCSTCTTVCPRTHQRAGDDLGHRGIVLHQQDAQRWQYRQHCRLARRADGLPRQGNGRRTRKRAPLPGWLTTSIRPPIATASSWQIASPNPLPRSASSARAVSLLEAMEQALLLLGIDARAAVMQSTAHPFLPGGRPGRRGHVR